MASREELINQRKLLQRKVSSGTATSADREKLKAIKGQLADSDAFTGTEAQRRAENALLSQRRSEMNRQKNQLNTGKKASSVPKAGPKNAVAARHILNDDPSLAQANEFKGVKTPTNPKHILDDNPKSAATKKKSPSLGDIFKAKNWKKTSKGDDDYSPAKRTYDTPFGEIDLDTSKEGMFGDSELYDMGQKKGGRLKKAAGKKASGKKAVKKSATRKRAALRGHRAELRGG
jgi:cell division protein FtsB